MGLYGEQVLPRIINLACSRPPGKPLRERVCATLAGDVIEIGFGTGLNVPFYPPAVRHVSAIEPSDLAWKLAGERIASSAVKVDRGGLDGQALGFDDDSFDCAVSTWTMCTIVDIDAALAELRRVLRPGGTLHFVEHGLAPDESVIRWQRRLEPVQKCLVGGCHLTRQIVDLVEGAGFTIKEVETFYEEGAPRVLGADSLGLAAN
jgi:ubiquinone/menaquinone biosynthesis C-methylase UbiE